MLVPPPPLGRTMQDANGTDNATSVTGLVDVGLSNVAYARGLQLQRGRSYHAQVLSRFPLGIPNTGATAWHGQPACWVSPAQIVRPEGRAPRMARGIGRRLGHP